MAATYILPADLPLFYDANRVLELLVDHSDTSVDATLADLTNTSSGPYLIAINAIRSAASDVDQHCQEGKRYTRADLEAIIADAIANPADEAKQKRAATIRQVVADLTFGYLMARRGYAADQMDKMAPRYRDALDVLAKLAQGVRVFDLDSALQASGPARVAIGSNAYRPSLDNKMFGVWADTPNERLFGRWW